MVIMLEKQKSLRKTNKVTKSNDLIQSTHRLTLQENRIISTLISMVEPTDEHFKIYKFSVKEFQDMIGVKGNMHDYLKRIVTGLQEKTLEIPTGESTLVVNWLASAEYFDDGFIELEISNKLKPYLLGLKERFTSYHLQYIIKLNSFYSMRLYELLKQYQFIKYNNKRVELDTLRNWLGFIDKDREKYIQYGHFNAKVLKVAEKEINEKTDITFSYTEIKEGRKVVAIEFKIQSKVASSIETGNKGLPNPENEKDLKTKLLSLGVSNLQIKKILYEIPEEQIIRNIAYVISKKEIGEIKKLGGFTYKAIIEDYASSEVNMNKGKEKKPIRKEIIPDSILKGDEEDRVKANGSLEERQNLFLAKKGSQEEFEKTLLKLYDIKIRLAKSLLEIEEKEELGKQQLREAFEQDIHERLSLLLPLINVEDFKDSMLREIYNEVLIKKFEPIT
jgi:hypothetical protein